MAYIPTLCCITEIGCSHKSKFIYQSNFYKSGRCHDHMGVEVAPMASSRVNKRGGARNTFSSAAVVLILFNFFSRTGFTCVPAKVRSRFCKCHELAPYCKHPLTYDRLWKFPIAKECMTIHFLHSIQAIASRGYGPQIHRS